MRAPTLPEQLVAAVALLSLVTLGAWPLTVWRLGPGAYPWLLPLFSALGLGLGAWLRVAIRMLRLQHRVAAAYAARLQKMRLQIEGTTRS